MAEELAPSFCWRDIPECGARVENPRLRQPVCLIVDDPTPGYNPAYFHSGFLNGPMHVPPTLIDEVADLFETTGMRGKFSVIPMPFGLGRIDQAIDGVPSADVRHFLDVVRTRIAPLLDITPEALTHWNAIDLPSGRLLPLWEHEWSRLQSRETLHAYMCRALEILNAVNIPCTGVTSPWDFGDGVENDYAEAILSAQKAVNGRSLSWYFLQMDSKSRNVPPRMSVFNREAGEAVVSLVSCDAFDFGRGVWSGGLPDPDLLISADGQSGRLAGVLAAGGPAAFHTHWQTLFSQGTRSGLRALGEIADRLHEHFGDRMAWTGAFDLATYTAATAAVQIAADTGTKSASEPDGNVRLRLSTPFPCARFTMSVRAERPAQAVFVDDEPLTRSSHDATLEEGCYRVAGDRVYLCWPLKSDQRVKIVSA